VRLMHPSQGSTSCIFFRCRSGRDRFVRGSSECRFLSLDPSQLPCGLCQEEYRHAWVQNYFWIDRKRNRRRAVASQDFC
jgi:hypothetical protein